MLGDAFLYPVRPCDQIDPLGPPGDTTVELIDYKTGRPRTQKDADQSLQLSIYALAAREQLKLKPAQLTFYNLTKNLRAGFAKVIEQVAAGKVKKCIIVIRKELLSAFLPQLGATTSVFETTINNRNELPKEISLI
jgi:hypothetical protein